MASESEILSLTVPELAHAIKTGNITAVQALKAYRHRAEQIDRACNAVICFVKEADQWAAEADEYLARTGQVHGPLHGVPFSLKDHFSLKNYPITMGSELLKERTKTKPARFNCAIDIALVRAGAIPFCKTTMTQLGETSGGGSPAHGDAFDPWDTMRTTGGSSCGEGALVGGGGSPFGIGSDVGGSVRIPAAHCGLCTLKPTAKRTTFNFENGKTILNHPGDYAILASAGPMARCVEDLVEVLGALWTEALFELDTSMPPMPLNRAVLEDTRPLRIGWYVEEYTYPRPCPAAVRALEAARDALQAAGHTLVPFRAASEGKVTREDIRGCDYAMLALDNKSGLPAKGQSEKGEIKVGNYGGSFMRGERTHPDLAAAYTPAPQGTKSARKASMPRTSTPGLYQAAIAQRDVLRDCFAAYWRDLQLDALICPAWPFPAPPVEEVRNYHRGDVDGTRMFNFLDYPAGVVTVTKVTAEDLAKPYDPDTDDQFMVQCAQASVANSLGLPMAVQVVALPWREELCLRVMLEVQGHLPFDHTQHARLMPVPRRSPDLGARPEAITTGPVSKL